MSTDSSRWLPRAAYDQICERRTKEPDFVLSVARDRRRRPSLAPNGRLNLVAADHPARGITGVQDDRWAMADRYDYLARIVRALLAPRVDGVMATMDVLEELLILDGVRREQNLKPLLGSKLMIASVNRCGLLGSDWELNDPPTGVDVATCQAFGIDGVKLLLRIADDDRDTLSTLTACSRAITEFNAAALPTFLEPLPVRRSDSGWEIVREAGALARVVGIASALGSSSRHLWLKLPYCESFERVAAATTLPILILGGPSTSAGESHVLLQEIATAMFAGTNVRGTFIGRRLLYGDQDPRRLAASIGGLVHGEHSLQQAIKALQ